MTTLCLDFHGIPLTFDCDIAVEPAEKPSRDSPGYAAQVGVTKIRFEGEEIDPDDDVWEALHDAANRHVKQEAKDADR